jgi:hypothetical protein
MYNLRYHIASLVAVFLSLSIGLLLGTIVVERGTLDSQRDTIVQSLQEEFRTLSEDNSEMRAEISSQEGLIDTLLGISVDGSLQGRTVLVVASTGRADGLGSTTDAIRNAGGTPVTLLLSTPSFGVDDPAVSAVITETIGPAETDAMLDETVSELAAEWSVPGEVRPLTDSLDELGVLRVDGDTGDAVDAIVVLASFDDVPDEGALALAQALAERGATACGVESETQVTGVAAAALEAGLSGVDHIGTPEGAYSMTWVLAGRASGYFGTGDGAQAPWPE